MGEKMEMGMEIKGEIMGLYWDPTVFLWINIRKLLRLIWVYDNLLKIMIMYVFPILTITNSINLYILSLI